MLKSIKYNWIWNKSFDSLFIILPQFIGLFLLILFQSFFQSHNLTIPLTAWVILILGIDVSHVYSTLFRTYFDKQSWKQNSNTLILIPFVGLVLGILVYSMGAIYFWRLLAYLAVFHFIRQQYGFVRLYSKSLTLPSWSAQIDKISVYGFTIIPILIWHFTGMKNFNWFIDGDFFYFENTYLKNGAQYLFFILLIIYIGKEIYSLFHHESFSLPKFLFMMGTALSWYIGIVLYNGDLIFTLLNVVSHGIPYIALVWYFGYKNYKSSDENPLLSKLFKFKYLILFASCLLVFAYFEEGIWDSLVWNEHKTIFKMFSYFKPISEDYLVFIIPFLTLPQWTHYVLDGFIWKIGNDNFYWKKIG